MKGGAISLRFHIARRLQRSPVFTGITLLTIAIGIGANTAIFSVVHSVLLQPLPYDHPEELVGLWHTAKGLNLDEVQMCPSLYLTDRENAHSFTDIGLWDGGSVAISKAGGQPEQVESLSLTDGVLPLLRVKPVLGRVFTKRDDTHGSPRTLMLTQQYWASSFGSAASVIGEHIRVDGDDREIIGVLPASFRFRNPQPSVVLPFQFDRSNLFLGNFSYQGIARVKPGVTIGMANAEIGRLIPTWLDSWPPPPGFDAHLFRDAKLAPAVRPFMRDIVGDIGGVLWVVMGTIALVLVIACANVANLLLVRAEGRQQELAVRAALGAGWRKLASDLLSESLTLGVLGGVLGLVLAYGGLRLLVAIGPSTLPRMDEIRIDPTALLFTFFVSLLSGACFGLLPVLKYAFVRPTFGLRDSNRSASAGRDRQRVRNVLAIAQIAMALVLLIGSGLMNRTFLALRRIEPGFLKAAEVQTLNLYIPESKIKDGVQTMRKHQDLLERVRAVPGVQAASFGSSVTMDGHTSNDVVLVEDHPAVAGKVPPIRRFKFIAPGYFQTLGRRFIAGRDLNWNDLYAFHPVVLVSEKMARDTWGSAQAAIGRRIREGMKDEWRQVIGVVADEYDDGVQKPAPAIVYWPTLMSEFWGDKPYVGRYMCYTIRSGRAGSLSLVRDLQRAIWSVTPDLPLADVRTLQEVYSKSLARTSFTLVMLGIAGSMALVLGLIGIYGVISYSVSQRVREIGIRMALGAQREQVSRMFVRHGLVLAGIGVTVGAVLALALTRLLSSLLFGVSAADPITFTLTAIGLIAATAMASYLPSRRASLVDPTEALRQE